MRSIFCRVIKVPPVGSELRLCYTAARGGRTEAVYKVRSQTMIPTEYDDNDSVTVQGIDRPPTAEEIADGLSSAIGSQWTGELFSCKARRDEIVITCGHDDISFYPMHNGTVEAGREYLQVEY